MLENLFQAILIALVNISESEESKAQGHEAEDSRERSELYDVDDHEMTQTQGQDDRGGEAEATALGREAREQEDGPKDRPECRPAGLCCPVSRVSCPQKKSVIRKRRVRDIVGHPEGAWF